MIKGYESMSMYVIVGKIEQARGKVIIINLILTNTGNSGIHCAWARQIALKYNKLVYIPTTVT